MKLFDDSQAQATLIGSILRAIFGGAAETSMPDKSSLLGMLINAVQTAMVA